MNGGRQVLACRPPFYSWGSFGLFAQEAIQERHDLGPGAVIAGREGGGGSAAGDTVLNGPCNGIVVVHTTLHILERDSSLDCLGTGIPPQEGDDLRASASGIGRESSVGGSDRDPLLHGPQDGLVIIRIALYICERITSRCGLGRAGSTPQEGDSLGAGAACIGRECGLGGALCDTIEYRPTHCVRIVGIGGNIGKGYAAAQRYKCGLDGDCGARHGETVLTIAERSHRNIFTVFVRHCDGLHTIAIIRGNSDRNGLAFRCVGGADRNAAVLRLLRYSYRIGGAATGRTDTYLLLQ